LIKELRDKLDLTQEQFAQKVGVTLNDTNLTSKIDPPHLLSSPLEGEEGKERGKGNSYAFKLHPHLPPPLRERKGRRGGKEIPMHSNYTPTYLPP